MHRVPYNRKYIYTQFMIKINYGSSESVKIVQMFI